MPRAKIMDDFERDAHADLGWKLQLAHKVASVTGWEPATIKVEFSFTGGYSPLTTGRAGTWQSGSRKIKGYVTSSDGKESSPRRLAFTAKLVMRRPDYTFPMFFTCIDLDFANGG